MKTHTHFPIQLGDPVEHRGVVIAPLFPRTDPRAEYLTLDEAIPLGFHLTELDAAGSVPELLAKNPLDSNVLLYDGEELLNPCLKSRRGRDASTAATVSALSSPKGCQPRQRAGGQPASAASAAAASAPSSSKQRPVSNRATRPRSWSSAAT